MTRSTSYFISCALLAVSAVTLSFGQTTAPQPMITERVDSSQLVTLKGNVHPLAQSLTDLGVASPNLPLHRMLLLLNHSPAQDAALARFIDEQQEKESPNYHQWLTPEQFGQQFGASMQDIQTIGAWLQSNGFQVTQVSKGRNVIEFSGTAGQVAQVFHTSIHSYLGSDGPHWANASDPQIPAALAPAIAGIDSLNNFPRTAANRFAGVYSMSSHSMTSQPQFTFGCGFEPNNQPITCYAVSPYDFATIYNVLPLWTAGTDGTGETIAVVGRSNVNPQDVNTFRSLFDLPPADSQHFQVILNGPDPGLNGDESEANIDVQWAGAVAKNAKIDFVISQSTETTDGVDLSAFYIIDNNLAPILSESFGQCELFLGTAGNSFYQILWQQAAAQGISVFISTGDNGAAGCDNNVGTVPQPATEGLAVSGLASTPYNVAVGGTDFNDFANPLTYWSSTNDPTTHASALSYIPETTWNDSCTSALFPSLSGFSTNLETNCNDSQLLDLVWTVGASGGASNCTTSNGLSPSSCTGGHPKPSWQTGAGVPNDGKRDIPDVSLFASNGFVGNFYVICEQDITGICNLNNLAGFGGTSVSTPAFAGIMALINQTMGGRQGNPNYVLYKLAAAKPSAFHDVPSGSTIAMPCQSGSPNCTVNTPGHTFGVQSGYATGPNYDLATGWGSVDANALVTNWNSVTFKSSATTMTAPTPTSITHGQQVSTTITVAAVPPATGTPTGDVSLITSTGQSVGGFTLSGGSVNATTSLLPGGNYTISAHYAGDGTFGESDSVPSTTITVTPEASKSTLQMETFDFNGNRTNPNATTAVYGSVYLLRANVTNAGGTLCAPPPSGQVACPTGTVAFTDNGNALDGGNFTLNSLGYTEDQLGTLTGGTHSIQAQYQGDVSFTASSSSESVTITPATTSFTEFAIPLSGDSTTSFDFQVVVKAASFGAAPTGTVSFFSDGVLLGTGITNGIPGSDTGTATIDAILSTRLPIGTHAITATYSGDTNYSSANAGPTLIRIQAAAPSVTIMPPTQTVNSGETVTITALVDGVTAGPAITGSVTFVEANTLNPIPGTVALTPGTDSNGNPTLLASLTFTPAGSMNVQAEYSGDSNYPAVVSSGMITITVNGTDFAIVTSPTVLVFPGGDASFEVRINGQAGYNGTINFTSASCSGLPPESTCSFSPASLTGSGNTFGSIQTTIAHSRGTKQAKFMHAPQWWTLMGGGLFSCVLLFGVPKKRRWSKMFSLLFFALLMTSVSCGGGGSSGGSGGGGGGSGVGDPGTPLGSYTVTITATSGTLTHSTSFSLIVR